VKSRAERAAFTPAALARELALLLPDWPDVQLCVAFSGGADSVALLAALAQLRRRHPRLALRAVHIDHHLQPGSGQWRRDCARLARSLRVAFSVRHARIVPRRGASLEALARTERYRLLGAQLAPGETLLTAHHEDDQFETVLLQLLRGAGVAGLAAMPRRAPLGRGQLMRPLLGFTRAQLRAFVAASGLPFTEDPSNADLRFDRNFLRARLVPGIRERWPGASAVLARSARHFAEARELLAELAARDLQPLARDARLRIVGLRQLSAARQRNAVRHWVVREGLAVPDSAHLARILGELCAARADANPLVAWPGGELRRHRGELYALQPAQPAPRALAWRLSRARVLGLPAGLGSLRLRADARGELALARLPRTLRVRFRAGGESLRTQARGPTRRLKELLRAAGIPPWLRTRIPLIYAGARLVAVADLWVDAPWQATPRTRRRGRIEWRGRPLLLP
jgi:tRNA(Ile)-lysidine synthase